MKKVDLIKEMAFREKAVIDFFYRFANTPLDDRFTVIDFNKGGTMTLTDIYYELERLEEAMRPMKIREDELLELAQDYFKMKEESDTAKMKIKKV